MTYVLLPPPSPIKLELICAYIAGINETTCFPNKTLAAFLTPKRKLPDYQTTPALDLPLLAILLAMDSVLGTQLDLIGLRLPADIPHVSRAPTLCVCLLDFYDAIPTTSEG